MNYRKGISKKRSVSELIRRKKRYNKSGSKDGQRQVSNENVGYSRFPLPLNHSHLYQRINSAGTSIHAAANVTNNSSYWVDEPVLRGTRSPHLYHSVFISHSSLNKEFARILNENLCQMGVTTWFDENEMLPGDLIFKSISCGISDTDRTILICSQESLKSWWVGYEIEQALAKERKLSAERGKEVHLLIPITIDDFIFTWDDAKAGGIKRYYIGDFRGWQNEEKFAHALNKLARALQVDRPSY